MGIANLIFPKFCLECGVSGTYICSNCLAKVAPGRTNFWQTRDLDAFVPVWAYEGVIKKAILVLKYRFAQSLAQDLAQVTAEVLLERRANFKKAVLIPVPLYPQKLKWRGFNQALKVGEILAQMAGWEVVPDLVLKTKSTPPQMRLTKKERLKNIKGTFSLNSEYPVENLSGQQIVIFDDVATTGATLEEVAKVLKKLQPANICGLTLAG